MNIIFEGEVWKYINTGIDQLHKKRIETILKSTLEDLFFLNPYQFFINERISLVDTVIREYLSIYLQLTNEEFLGEFLKKLAIFIANKEINANPSLLPGIDFEFFTKGVHYLVNIETSPDLIDKGQESKWEQSFKKAVDQVQKNDLNTPLQSVLGICYGKTKTSYLRGYMKVTGQNFWYLISENPNLYTDIIEPIGFHAREHNDRFCLERDKLINRLTKQFLDRFCDEDGMIIWNRLVEWNSGNLDKELSRTLEK